MVNTSRETREELFIQWYEKKLNRDELLRVLKGSEIFDEEDRERIKSEIIKDFYENFEKAKEGEGFKSADAEYRDIKSTKRKLKEKSAELIQKKEGSDSELQEIDSQMLDIAEMAMNLENGSWLKKWKLGNTNKRRDELEAQQRKIKKEIGELGREEAELQTSLKEKEEKYGPKKERTIKELKKIELAGTVKEKLKKQTTLKGYREKYFQALQDREGYMKKLLSEIESMDFGIGKEKKEEILGKIKENMQEEINTMRGGDKMTKLADKIEEWLKNNWEQTMGKLLELDKKIEDMEGQIKEKEAKLEGAGINEVLQIKLKIIELQKDKTRLQDEFNITKGEIDGKLEQYEGKDEKGEIVEESWEEREKRRERRKGR